MADSLVRLRIDSNEFDAKLKTASQNLQSYFDKVKQGAGTFEHLDDGVLDCAKALGQLSTKSNTARGSIAELTSSFTEWSLRYKQMTEAEKKTPLGREIKNSLDQLKTRIQDTKKDLASINQELSGSKFGQFGSIIDGIGRRMGVNANITELLTSKTALMTAGIGAAVTAIYKGTEAWAKYNAELAKQDQQTQVITGLKGSEADHMTDTVRAISDTYKVDFRQAIEAANTLMVQFGVSGTEAIKLIKDGMQGMIQGDGGKLLNMIQQFAPAFRDAGISADKLVAIIHNSEGGLFSDKNMNAILMGIKNIRLMTRATSESLAKLGIDGQEMSRKMSDGTLTVFEALKQVATKLKDCEAGSQDAGQVMQNVFGRQGAMQGMKLARAIAELNTNLEETKRQTGELGDAFADLQTANEKLNTAIRDCFEYDGWEQMATGIKAKLVTALADVLQKLADIKAQFQGLTPPSAENAEQRRITTRVEDVRNAPEEKRQELIDKYRSSYQSMETWAWRKYNNAQANLKNGVGYYKDERGMSVSYVDEARKFKEAAENYRRYREEFENEVNKITSQEQNKPEPNTPDTNGPKTTTAATVKELNPMQQAQKEISALTEEALTADEERLEVIKKEIAALQEQVKVYQSIQNYAQGKEPNWKIQVGDRKAFEAEQKKRFEAEAGTPSRLQSMQYSVMKEIKAEDIKVDTETLHTLLKDALQNGIDTTSLDLTSIAEQIGKGINVPDEKWQEILDKYNELREAIGENPIQIDLNTGNASGGGQNGKGKGGKGIEGMDVSSINKITSSVSNIASGLQRLGVEIPEGFEKTIGVLQLITTLISALQTITAIGAIKPFASGGIVRANDGVFVPGSSYSGDRVPALLNSGEMVLNSFQQEALAGTLQNRYNERGNESTPYVSGEQIYLGLSNYLRRTGRGELLTAKG